MKPMRMATMTERQPTAAAAGAPLPDDAPLIERVGRLAELTLLRAERRARGETVPNELTAELRALERSVLAEPAADGPLGRFFAKYELDHFERRLIALLLAYQIFPAIEKRFDALAEERLGTGDLMPRTVIPFLTEGFAAELKARAYFAVGSRLITNGLIVFKGSRFDDETLFTRRLRLDQRVASYLLGDEHIYANDTAVRWEWSNQSLDAVVLPPAIMDPLKRFMDNYRSFQARTASLEASRALAYGTTASFLFHGESGVGKTMLACGMAHRLGKKLFIIRKPEGESGRRQDLSEVVTRAFFEFQLHDGILYIDECDDLFEGDSEASRQLLIELERCRGLVILSTNNLSRLDAALERRILYKYELPLPDAAARETMWRYYLTESGLALTGDTDLADLARRYSFPGGYIKNALLYLLSQRKENGGDGPVTAAELDRVGEHYLLRYQEATAGQSKLPALAFIEPDHAIAPEPDRVHQGPLARALAAAAHYLAGRDRPDWLEQQVALSIALKGQDLDAAERVARAFAASQRLPVLVVRTSDFFNDDDDRPSWRRKAGETRFDLCNYLLEIVAKNRPVLVIVNDADEHALPGRSEQRFYDLWKHSKTHELVRFFIYEQEGDHKSRLFDYKLPLGWTELKRGRLAAGLKRIELPVSGAFITGLIPPEADERSINRIHKRIWCEQAAIRAATNPKVELARLVKEATDGLRSREPLFGDGNLKA